MVVKKGLSWLLLTRLLTQWEVLWLSDWSIGAELCVTLRTAQKHPTATILLTSLLQKDWEETQRELASHVTLAVDRGLYHTCWGRWSLAYGSLPSCHPCYRQTELESEGWVSRLCPQPSSGENHHALCTHESIFFFFFTWQSLWEQGPCHLNTLHSLGAFLQGALWGAPSPSAGLVWSCFAFQSVIHTAAEGLGQPLQVDSFKLVATLSLHC